MQLFGKTFRWTQLAGIVLNLFLIAEVFLLVIQNRDLRSQIEEAKKQQEPLQKGEVVTAFEGVSLDGTPVKVTYQDPNKRYLFFLLSTTCSICENNLPNWNTLVDEIKDTNTIIYGLTLEDQKVTQDYISTKATSFKVATINDINFSRIYKVYGYPLTFLINGKGSVIQAWAGTLIPSKREEIKKLLNVSVG